MPDRTYPAKPVRLADGLDLKPRKAPARLIQRIRNSHHRVAMLAATGIPQMEIAGRTGYSFNRISLLLADPAMIELVARYRDEAIDSWKDKVGEFNDLAYENMIKAERQISDRLDEADQDDTTLPIRELVAISRDAADRLGYGKRTTNLNVNIDFAAKLEAAIRRSATAKVIDDAA